MHSWTLWQVPALLMISLVHIFALENGIDKGTFKCSSKNKHIVVHAEKGDFGHVMSEGFPDPYNQKSNLTDEGGGGGDEGDDVGWWCEVTIKGCSSCKIRLTLVTVALPACNFTKGRDKSDTLVDTDQNSATDICIPGCDHIHIHEVDFPYNNVTHANYDGRDEGRTIKSISAHVRLRHCVSGSSQASGKRFNIHFVSVDKNELHQGMVAQYKQSFGVVRSPNFPHGYAMNGETFTYMVQNLDPYGHVRLMAVDWDIAPESEVTIYDGFGEKAPFMVLKRYKRPVLVSDSSTLILVFSTGSASRACCYHAGFKLAFEFVSDKSWPQRPITDCSAFYPMQGGGMIDFTGATTIPSLYDCVWVIKRENSDNKADGVVLRLTEVLLGDGWLQYGKMNTLEIHQGTNSESLMLYKYTAKNLTHAPPSYFSTDGLYIRLRGGFYSTDKLSFIFTAVKNVSLEKTGCPGLFDFMCKSMICIDQHLMCDGIDHCGDRSDESPALDCSMSAIWRLSFKWSMPYVAEPTTLRTTSCSGFTCRSDGRCLASRMRCNGIRECGGGEDERGCYTTTDAFSPAPRLVLDVLNFLVCFSAMTLSSVIYR